MEKSLLVPLNREEIGEPSKSKRRAKVESRIKLKEDLRSDLSSGSRIIQLLPIRITFGARPYHFDYLTSLSWGALKSFAAFAQNFSNRAKDYEIAAGRIDVTSRAVNRRYSSPDFTHIQMYSNVISPNAPLRPLFLFVEPRDRAMNPVASNGPIERQGSISLAPR
jgi:hypothetical protein